MKQNPARTSASLSRSAIFAALFMLSGLAPVAAQAAPSHACQNCGTVISTHTYQKAAEHGSGLGIATGAVLGGLLGNQVGSGNGRSVATVAGAVGGGYAGNEVEKRARTSTVTEVRVRMSNGSVRTFTEPGSSRRHSGQHVKLVKGVLRAG